MPSGIYERTEKNSKGLFKKGYCPSLECRLKISKSHLGKKLTKEHRLKISEKNRGKKRTIETRKKLRLVNLGKKLSLETKIKISKTLTGRKNKPHSEETKQKIRLSQLKEKSNNWKGGINHRSDGYIMIYKPEHPFAISNYVMQHRLVMEEFLKRYLYKHEVIHHINFNRSDNRIENLYLFHNRKEHTKFHRKIGKDETGFPINPTEQETQEMLSKL